jgi:tetratricopeptide (TPR) repeat protein
MQGLSRRGSFASLRWLLPLVGAALLIGPASAWAQPAAHTGAAELCAKGRAAYAAKDREAALRFFQSAWALTHTPDIAANLALIELKLGRYRDAAEHFQFARLNMPPSSTDKQEQAIINGLSEAKLRTSTLVFSIVPEGAEVLIDGTSVGKTPLEREVYVEPADHVIDVEHEGYAAKQWKLTTDPGSSHTLAVTLEPEEPRPEAGRPASVRKEEARRAVDWEQRSVVPLAIGGGLTLAAAAAGIIFTLRASSERVKAGLARAELPPSDSTCGSGARYVVQCQRLSDAVAANRWNAGAATVSFVVAGAALAGSATYFFWPRARGPRPSAVLTPGVQYVSLQTDW